MPSDSPRQDLDGGGSRHGDLVTASAAAAPTPTPLGRALLVVGDQWNMLIIRSAFQHVRRFNDFRDALGVSDGVLASRLNDLVGDGVLTTTAYSAHPNRVDYLLSEMGRDLWPIFVAAWRWEQTWERDSAETHRLVHRTCGMEIMPEFGCETCGERVTHRELTASERPDATFAESNPPRRYRRSSIEGSGETGVAHPALVRLLGDRWSVSVLAGAMLGMRRFGDLQDRLGISPHLLSERLAEFVESGVLRQIPIKAGAKRHEYRLTPKGIDLMPAFLLTNDWAQRWFEDPRGPDLVMLHRVGPLPSDEHGLTPTWFCDECGRRLERHQIEFV